MSNDRPRPIFLSYLPRNRVRLSFGLLCRGGVIVFAVVGVLFASFIWVRSYWKADTLYYYAAGKGSFFSLASSKGSLGFVWDKPNRHSDNGPVSYYGDQVDNPWDFMPLAGAHRSYRWGPVQYYDFDDEYLKGPQIVVPDWCVLITLASMFLALCVLISVWRRHVTRRGRFLT
jgi:hypothetical protein